MNHVVNERLTLSLFIKREAFKINIFQASRINKLYSFDEQLFLFET